MKDGGKLTTYDTIYQYFHRNTHVDFFDLPSTISEQILLIKDGVDEYNFRLEAELECNDDNETLNEDLPNVHIKFLSECMKLRIYTRMLDSYVSLMEVFQNDMGRKNYKDQLNARQFLILRQEEIINKLLNRIYDDYTGGEN